MLRRACSITVALIGLSTIVQAAEWSRPLGRSVPAPKGRLLVKFTVEGTHDERIGLSWAKRRYRYEAEASIDLVVKGEFFCDPIAEDCNKVAAAIEAKTPRPASEPSPAFMQYAAANGLFERMKACRASGSDDKTMACLAQASDAIREKLKAECAAKKAAPALCADLVTLEAGADDTAAEDEARTKFEAEQRRRESAFRRYLPTGCKVTVLIDSHTDGLGYDDAAKPYNYQEMFGTGGAVPAAKAICDAVVVVGRDSETATVRFGFRDIAVPTTGKTVYPTATLPSKSDRGLEAGWSAIPLPYEKKTMPITSLTRFGETVTRPGKAPSRLLSHLEKASESGQSTTRLTWSFEGE